MQAIVNSMATYKAHGIDKIPERVIKDCLPAILPSLTSIINASFTTNTFPDAWKLAEVTPVLKSDDHEVPNNNRPISLLPVLSKVCERAAFNQFTTYQVSNEQLTSKQNGNKQHHSTKTTLIHTTDQILHAIDDKQLTAMVLLNMSKAFDSLNHGILLAKLQDVGASTTALQWFRSYLSSRYQVVHINSTMSDCFQVRNGVPREVYSAHFCSAFTLMTCHQSHITAPHNAMLMTPNLQYCSKVSYHLSSRFSRDASRFSRESLKRLVWHIQYYAQRVFPA